MCHFISMCQHIDTNPGKSSAFLDFDVKRISIHPGNLALRAAKTNYRNWSRGLLWCANASVRSCITRRRLFDIW